MSTLPPDPRQLEPIEGEVRSTESLGNDVEAVRGGPLTAEKLADQARLQSLEYSWRGRPMHAVSVFCTVDGWDVGTILGEILPTRSTFATTSLGELRAADHVVLATHQSPHFDIVLSAATEEEAGRLLSLFGEARANPHRSRRI